MCYATRSLCSEPFCQSFDQFLHTRCPDFNAEHNTCNALVVTRHTQRVRCLYCMVRLMRDLDRTMMSGATVQRTRRQQAQQREFAEASAGAEARMDEEAEGN